MPISSGRLRMLIEQEEIKITPYNEKDLTQYGYNVHIGEIVKVAEIKNGYNDMIDTAIPPTYTVCDITDDGFVLDPMKTYYVALKEKVESDNYSMELVPNSTLIQSGLTLGLSSTSLPPSAIGSAVCVTVKQPLKIHKNYNIANARFTATEDSGGFPAGTILMYSGSTIPYGWALCNGENGTPDLRSKFVLGGNAEDVGRTGGSNTTTLSVSNLPSHSHNINISSSSTSSLDVMTPYDYYLETTVDDPASQPVQASSDGASTPIASSGTSDVTSAADTSSAVAGKAFQIPLYESDKSHTGTVEGEFTISGSTESVGSGAAFSTMPAYYTLMYIMKK